MRLAIALIRDGRKPFEETEIPDNESDMDHTTVSSDDCDVKEDVDDSPWEISSDSSNGDRPTLRDSPNASSYARILKRRVARLKLENGAAERTEQKLEESR